MNFSSDLKWCIENDYQVYILPVGYNDIRIAIRKGGISSQGKDYYVDKQGIEHYSSEIIGRVVYRNQKDAMKSYPDVIKRLRKKYDNT
tara:strand:- start:36136 stop:36399 length:264 start_codon:yes stop_codon:yes gene_type:complete